MFSLPCLLLIDIVNLFPRGPRPAPNRSCHVATWEERGGRLGPWNEALIRPSGTFSHPCGTGEGLVGRSRNASFSRWRRQWEKVADRPDEGRAQKRMAGTSPAMMGCGG